MEVEENTSDRCRWIKVNWAKSLEMGPNRKSAAWHFPPLQPGCHVSVRRNHLVYGDLVHTPTQVRQRRDVEMDVVDYRGLHMDVYRYLGYLGGVHSGAVFLQVRKHETWKAR